MTLLRVAWRQLAREWNSPVMLTLLLAVAVAAGAISAVGSLTDRVARALDRNAGEMLAADLAVSSRATLTDAWLNEAQRRNLRSAEIVSFPTVIFAGDNSQLVDLKAVTSDYPLRGELRIADNLDAEGSDIPGGPPVGQAWAEPRLFASLGLTAGDPIQVGNSELILSQVLRYEPDRGGDLYALAPRLMLNHEDMLQAGLLGPGSRAWYRQLYAGGEAEVREFEAWLEQRLAPGQRLLTAADEQPQVGSALGQADRFLATAALVTLLIAGAAILLAASQFSDRHRDTAALLRCLGASHRAIMGILSLELVLVALVAALGGGLLGYLAQSVLAEMFAGAVSGGLPPATWQPLVFALLIGLLLAAGFALPPLWRLRRVPPARVLNRSVDDARGSDRWLWLLPLVVIAGLSYYQLGHAQLTLIVVGGTLAAGVVMLAAAYGIIRLLKRGLGGAGGIWRFGLAGLARRARSGALQITGLGIGLTALLLLMVVRVDLLTGWRTSLPPDTPNRFLVNVQPDQRAAVADFLDASGADRLQLRPMATARLVRINGSEPQAEDFDDPRADRRINGTLNLSWSETLPPANRIVAGQWLDSASETPEISLAESWAEPLGLGLGDTLTFEAGADRFTGTVTSLREVDWDSFNVNFFILVSPSAAASFPHQFVGSFHAPDTSSGILRGMAQNFPNVTLLDVDAILIRVREIIERVSGAAEIVFLFTLAAGIAVLLAAISATRDERRTEAALLRTLGARNRSILAALVIEYSLTALVAGVLAAVAAGITGAVLATRVFQISDYNPDMTALALGAVAGAALLLVSGVVGNSGVLRVPPVKILRAA